MSHPFTLEYMQEGEVSSKHVSGDIKKREYRNRKESVARDSRIKPRQGRRICESVSETEGCQINQVEEISDGDLKEIEEAMDITIADKEKLSFVKILSMAMRHRMKIFANEASILGLSYLVKPSSHKVGFIIRKVIWTMLLLFGTGFMVFQIYDRISYYQSYPTVVNYRVAYNRSLRFPTVTICSEAMASKKVFISMGNKVNYFHKVTTFVNYFHYL